MNITPTKPHVILRISARILRFIGSFNRNMSKPLAVAVTLAQR